MKVIKRKSKKESSQNKLGRNILEIILAFVIAWIIYQGVAFATGTSMPIVSVVSQSMYHNQPLDAWWENKGDFYSNHNITKEEFKNFPMSNGLSRGDLLIVVYDGEPNVGDIIIYSKASDFTIVHRIIRIEGDTIITKGDNNIVEDAPVHRSQMQGKAVTAIPLLGYPRLALFAFGI